MTFVFSINLLFLIDKKYFMKSKKLGHRTEASNPTSSIDSILYHFVIQYDNGLSRPLDVLTLH
jgi:hypothetical protein